MSTESRDVGTFFPAYRPRVMMATRPTLRTTSPVSICFSGREAVALTLDHGGVMMWSFYVSWR